MLEIRDYGDLVLLQHVGQTEIFRGRRSTDDARVLIKVPLTEGASQLLQKEHALLTKFRIPGVAPALCLAQSAETPFLVLADPGGVPLKTYIRDHRPRGGEGLLASFFAIAAQTLDIVEALHKNRIIHKNLTARHLYVGTETPSVALADMSLASIFPKENPQIQSPQVMQGDLAYLSPEQTGRMNRALDYRTDFYSLGVILYEFLTGALPFEHADPLELIHSHLARAPRVPRDLNTDIPEVVSNLVLKLLAKAPEGRYQSAAGIKADIRECTRQWEKGRQISPFRLGAKDVPHTLCINSKLYGRDSQRALLLRLFEKASRGAMELVTVAGYSGIGKTSLVQETYKPVTARRGYFISGKFDRFHQNVPYSAVANAFQGLVRQILGEPQTRLEMWRAALKSVLGENARLITDVIPDLELIIGPQPPVVELGDLESQNRFNRVFKQFIGVFCRPEHPLVLFLDDLQWVDMASLRLLEFLVSNERIDHLFGIGAYRDNEVGPAHPLRAFLDAIQMAGAEVHQVQLAPLQLVDVTGMLADLLRQPMAAVDGLARLVMAKTYGNPFFIHQFLTAINQAGCLVFDSAAMQWTWDARAIHKMSIAENVVDLLIRRLKAMPPDTESMLKVAACLGNHFELTLLATVTGDPLARVFEHLLPALEEGLLVPVVAAGMLSAPSGASDNRFATTYRFLHDRVHQAAYALTSTDEKKSLHLGIGRMLLEIPGATFRDEHIFDILDHLNFAGDVIQNPKERDEVAALNLTAGRKAIASAAFEPGYTYLKAGLGFLREGSWETAYKLTLGLHTECHKAAHLCGHFAAMDDLFAIIVHKSKTPLDRAAAYKSRFLALAAQNLLPQSLDCALEILAELGEPISKDLSTEEIRWNFMHTVERLSRFNEQELLDWPTMTDPVKLAVTGILDAMVAPAFIGLPEFSPLVVSKQLQLTITHGHTPESPFSYTVMGGMLCKIGPDIETGYRFGQLAKTLAERQGSLDQKAKVLHSFTGYVDHWKRHLSETLKDTIKGYQMGLESGDFEFAGYNTYIHSKHSLYCGRPLQTVEREMTAYSEAVRQLKQEIPLGFNNIYRQTAHNLLGWAEDPTRLIGDAYDERTMLPKHRQANDRLALYYYNACRLMLCFLFGDLGAAVACAEAAEHEFKNIAAGPADYPISVFFGALAKLQRAHTQNTVQRQKAAVETIRYLDLLRAWADHAAVNHLHRLHLVTAERARLMGDDAKAFRHYDKALIHVRQSSYVNDEALVLELTGRYFRRLGRQALAADYLGEARQCYQRWEALAKVRDLEKRYAELLLPPRSTQGSVAQPAAHQITAPPPLSSGQLDRASLIKASQAIAEELELDRLLVTLIRVVIENAGADLGVLVLETDGQLCCAVRGTADGTQTLLKPFSRVSEEDRISAAVVNYVARTRKNLLLSDPAEQPAYGSDRHLQAARPCSVLCTPVIHQTSLVGILYLENSQLPDAFSTERLEVIELLVSRIAAAIVNARLFSDLKQAEEKYRSIFENAVEGIFQSTPDGQFISANPSMARLLGYDSPRELIERVTDIGQELYLDPADRDELIQGVLERSFVSGFETCFRRKTGDPLWVAINVRAVYAEDGRLLFIEGFVTDITERRRAMQALQDREETLRKENIRLRSDIRDRYRFGAIIGKSQAMQAVYELIIKAAVSDAPVIVYGESGTGKELVAQAVHEMSERKTHPFVAVNCGALPANLLESEFFGYKKGAFTGALADREGYLDQAHRGTLFLDELGEIDLNLQVKLLRVLDGVGYMPVGGRGLKKTDIRIIAATNQNLRDLVRRGDMREDFFFRVHVIPIHLPPLRERREDIPLLIDHFIETNGLDSNALRITGKMVEAMWRYAWPGNVRELMNVLHRYHSLEQFDLLGAETAAAHRVPDGRNTSQHPSGDFKSAMASFEKSLLKGALEDHRWHREQAARSLGIPLRTFFRKMSQHGLVRQK